MVITLRPSSTHLHKFFSLFLFISLLFSLGFFPKIQTLHRYHTPYPPLFSTCLYKYASYITSVLLKITVRTVLWKHFCLRGERNGKSSNFSSNYHRFSVQYIINALPRHLKISKLTNTQLISTYSFSLRRKNSDTRLMEFKFCLRFQTLFKFFQNKKIKFLKSFFTFTVYNLFTNININKCNF